MRQSKLFVKTARSVPKDIRLVSHRLLYQAGFIRESVAGRYYFLPLAMKVRDKIIKVVEEEMDKSGALKIITPVLHPIKLWQETNRTNSVGFELMKVKDRSKNEFVLGGTAEEMIVDLIKKFNVSYKSLPFNVYQFSQKFRDELRPRGGLLRVREFLMKDAYSFHANETDFKIEYDKMRQTYHQIFARLGLETVVVESDNGYIGGEYCHEFVVVSEAGESKFLISEDKQYAAHVDVAKFKKELKNIEEKLEKMVPVDAARGNSMQDGVKFHKLPLWQQIKDVMYVDDQNRFILAIIRGDFNVNEEKLKKLIKANNLRHATNEEIVNLKSEPGFISPVKISSRVIIVADDSLRTIRNAYGGANQKNKDLLNINIDRDYQPNLEGDIALAQEGFISEQGSVMHENKGIEVGNIFQLGHHYSSKMNANYIDAKGHEQLFYMGCYGIGIDRTLATIIEKYHDAKGMMWPKIAAPFQIHLLNLSQDLAVADKIYSYLQKQGFEVLYDDRKESAGIKFNDADLLGLPVRLVVSPKLGDQIEYKARHEKESKLINIEEISKYV